MARAKYRSVPRIFLCDGDALALSNNKLMPILDYIKENFPECERVSIYGRASDVIKKSDEEMKQLLDAGLTMVYIGANREVTRFLRMYAKERQGSSLSTVLRRLKRVECRRLLHLFQDLPGKDGWEEHAIETGTMITEMEPSYVGLLTLIVEPNVPMAKDIESGKLKLLSPEEVMAETLLMLKHTNVTKNVF